MSAREPIQLRDPVPPRPRLLGLRLAYWELREFWDVWAVLTGSWSYAGHRASTLRWTRNNYYRPRRCDCGAPGTLRVMDHPRPNSFAGDMSPWWWRCEDHARISLTACWRDGKPQVGQTREECSWTVGRTNGAITECGCGTHVGEATIG